MEIVRHFTTTVYPVFKDKVLLHMHKKYNILLPVGGHLDRDELPEEAAIREVKEEAGLDVVLYSSSENYIDEKGEGILNRGEYLDLHFVGPQHQHIDFVFFATAKSEVLKPNSGESKDLYWFSKEEIETSTCIKERVKKYALEALEKLK